MRILLAIDGSPCSNSAVDEVCRRPWPVGSEVRIITVLPPLEPPLGEVPDYPTVSACDYLFKQQAEEVSRLLDNSAAGVKLRAPDLCVSSVLLEGRPKDVILDEAERWSADLIVLGSHGRGIIRRLLLGSVSLAVVLNAPCSVEIVRCPPDFPSGESANVELD